MDPQALTAILAWLQQINQSNTATPSASPSGSGGAASVAPSAFGGSPSLFGQPPTPAGSPGNPSSPPFNYGTTQIVGLGNELGVGGLSDIIAKITTALGIPTIGDLIGLPTEAKTSGIETALAGTGSANDALISQFIGREVNAGNPLSNNSTDNDVRRFAAMVQALTGEGAPGATATGFQNNPTFDNPAMAKAIERFKLPAGYQFANNPSADADIYKDISGSIGLDASNIFGKSGQSDWQSVVRQLIQQGALTKYQGPLGAPGGGPTSAGSIPNVSLPHPLSSTANPAIAPAPYPV
jgi:hypothetical protein